MPFAAQSDWPRPSADRFPARYTVSPEASVFTGTVTFTVSVTDPHTGQLPCCTHWVTTAGVSTFWPAEMSMASRTYWAIAHISGVEELSGWPKVKPPVPVAAAPDLLGYLVAGVGRAGHGRQHGLRAGQVAGGHVVLAALAGQHRPRVATPDPV